MERKKMSYLQILRFMAYPFIVADEDETRHDFE